MNTIIITQIKYKKEKQKIENTLTTYGFKKINENTYIGKNSTEQKTLLTKELEINKQDNIILIPLCKKCYSNIQQIGQKINLEKEKYMIL